MVASCALTLLARPRQHRAAHRLTVVQIVVPLSILVHSYRDHHLSLARLALAALPPVLTDLAAAALLALAALPPVLADASAAALLALVALPPVLARHDEFTDERDGVRAASTNQTTKLRHELRSFCMQFLGLLLLTESENETEKSVL